MDNSGTKNASKVFKLNPNALSFVPAAKKIPAEWLTVEEFSSLWYRLMNTSPEYQQYWQKTCFQDEEDLFAGDMQALLDLDALVESEQAKQQIVGNKAVTHRSTGAGNKISSGDTTSSIDAFGVLSLRKDVFETNLSESTNAGDWQDVKPYNASADTRVFCPSPELLSNSRDNSQQHLEELPNSSNGKEVDPAHALTDIGCGVQSLERTSYKEDIPQQQLTESKDARNENEIDPVHLDTSINTYNGGDVHSLELSNSEDTPHQHLTVTTDQSDTVADDISDGTSDYVIVNN